MASVYSRQLFLGDIAASSTDTLYTVPSGITAVVRSIYMVPFGGGTPWTMFWEINSTFWSYFSAAASTDPFEWEGRVVMNPGDELKLETGSGGWAGVVSGYELS